MPKQSELARKLREVVCQEAGKSNPCAPRPDDLCRVVRKNREHPRRVTRDTIQDVDIANLKNRVNSLQKLVDMLVVLVDPEDVQAALRIEKLDLSHDELDDLGESGPPADLFGRE